jgi:predicted RNase H-like HicB family nuclease
MRIVTFDVRRDDEAGVWYASSASDAGIVTEAETIEALRERLKLLVPDFLETEEELRLDLDIKVSDIVQAA